jgi:hypothetical protein
MQPDSCFFSPVPFDPPLYRCADPNWSPLFVPPLHHWDHKPLADPKPSPGGRLFSLI